MVTVNNRPHPTSPSHRILKILACFQPIYVDEVFSYIPINAHTLQIYCQKWGDIGSISLDSTPGQPDFRFGPPQPISPDELPKYEKIISEECLGTRGRLAELFGQEDVIRNIRFQALYEKRLQRQLDFKVWLSSRLQIFGYRNLPFAPYSDHSEKLDEQFDFSIKGTPAQFGVMLRQFAQTLRSKADFQRLVCQVYLPGNRKDAGSILPDANPIEVKLTLGTSLMRIHAHVLPSDGTLLRIHLVGERSLWKLWDTIRDELEKLGWFTLPEIPDIPASVVSQPITNIEEQSQPAKPTAETWKTIPDVGANREILRLWHNGLTCEQIAVRVSLSAKTVLNRINKLRKEHGAEVVPYRKSNYIKDAKKKPS